MCILLIDDDKNLCRVISYQLEKNNYEVLVAHSGEEGLEKFNRNDVEVVLTDIQMPGINGLELLKRIRRENREVVIILITAYGSVENAVEACHLGADDYITKPFSQEQLLFVIEKTIRLRRLQNENRKLRQELSEKFQFNQMIVSSDEMHNVLQTARQVAKSNATVLILGESGTGKELLARAIHVNSPRKEKTFVVVNCPSIPENLIESELFGHIRGAFTGAIKDRKGKFEAADGGTLFLDEIGDLREDVQAKLLRVLQEGEFERLGGNRTIRVDVRIIAATNKDIEKLVQTGEFREDLYYRLNVVPIVIPPLRERKKDIPYLIDFFVDRYKKSDYIQIDPDIYEVLKKYDWPGNIRELENVIERAIVLSSEPRISLKNLPAHIIEKTRQKRSGSEELLLEDLSLENVERRAIERALEKSGGNKSKASR
ncbi:MAG: sigma-54-dependent Fis family transcriptional regulator, partial [Calditrichaeota bacterium]